MKGKKKGKTLICGNSDVDFRAIPEGLSETFTRAYLQNSFISDQKIIFTLPIGVENLDYGINGLPRNLKKIKSWRDRKAKILVGPFSPTHAERAELLKSASAVEVCEILSNYHASPRQYAQLVNEYRFVAIPRGNGADTHRFWEALYRGAIPVVKRSSWSSSLRNLEIPFIEVDDWRADSLSSAVKNTNFEEFEPSQIKSLWIDYWREEFSN